MRDGVEALRATGLEVRVVSPADFRHYGIAYGDGIVNNLRAAPWKLLALPLFLLGVRARGAQGLARRRRRARALAALGAPGARDREAVRAPALGLRRRPRAAGAAARASPRPPRPRRRLSPRRRSPRTPARSERATCASSRAAFGSRRRSRAGRAAARPLRRAPLGGEGRARARGGRTWPAARRRRRRAAPRAASRRRSGFVPPRELGAFYERAAVVVVPSRREGYGVVAREAMAYGRPVVATAVGGLVDAVEDGVTGLLVPPGDVGALRARSRRLLERRRAPQRLGEAARASARAILHRSVPRRVGGRLRRRRARRSRVAGVAASGRSVPPFRSRDADRRLVSYAQIGEDVAPRARALGSTSRLLRRRRGRGPGLEFRHPALLRRRVARDQHRARAGVRPARVRAPARREPSPCRRHSGGGARLLGLSSRHRALLAPPARSLLAAAGHSSRRERIRAGVSMPSSRSTRTRRSSS